MQSINIDYPGVMSSRSTGKAGGSFYDNTTVYTNRPRLKRYCAPGVMVAGDFKKPNAWSYQVIEMDYLKGSYVGTSYTAPSQYDFTTRDGCIGFYYYSSENPFFSDLGAFDSYTYNKALSKLVEKCRGSLDLSVDLAEAGKTAKMLNIIQRIRDYTHTTSWRTLIRGLSGARLEYQYGWFPLAMSLYETVGEMQNRVVSDLQDFKVRASSPIPNRNSAISVEFYGGVPCVVQRSGRHMCEIKVTLKTRSFDPARFASLNPISWAYELTPYSFVLDWMIDIGGYLRNLETSLLYANSFVGGYVTETIACDASASCNSSRGETAYGTVKTYKVTGTAGGRFIKSQRSVLASFPGPRLPTFKADLGASRLLSLAALLGGQIEKAKPNYRR